MTRPRPAADRFIKRLPPHLLDCLKPCFSPLLEIRPIDQIIIAEDARGLIFTSSNGVAVAAKAIRLRNTPCYCVGAETTQAAKAAGWKAMCVGESSGELVHTLLKMKPAGPLLHIHGANVRGDIAARLTKGGIETRSKVVYEQNELGMTEDAISSLLGRNQVVAPLFSPRTALLFAGQYPATAPVNLIALSEETAQPLRNLNYQSLAVADRPNAAAMIDQIEILVNRVCRVEGGQGPQ